MALGCICIAMPAGLAGGFGITSSIDEAADVLIDKKRLFFQPSVKQASTLFLKGTGYGLLALASMIGAYKSVQWANGYFKEAYTAKNFNGSN